MTRIEFHGSIETQFEEGCVILTSADGKECDFMDIMFEHFLKFNTPTTVDGNRKFENIHMLIWQGENHEDQ